MNRQPSLEQRQHARRVLVGLREHGLGGLGEDVCLRVGGHFLRHVRVADGGFARLGVFAARREVSDGVVEALGVGTHAGVFVQGVVDGIVEDVEGGVHVFARDDGGGVEPHGLCVHVVDVEAQVLVRLRAGVDDEGLPSVDFAAWCVENMIRGSSEKSEPLYSW